MEHDALHSYYRFYPAEKGCTEDMRTVMGDLRCSGMASLVPDIVFAAPNGHELKLQLLRPELHHEEGMPAHAPAPLIVFVQGSAWTNPNAHNEIPQLSEFARAGYVVASVTHRPSYEAPFPACLIDVKSAIRFLRAHADEYGIDPTRVAIWGTSSGGNLSLLVAATEGMAEFEQGEYLDQPSCVQAVVDFFGPSDPVEMMHLRGIDMSALASSDMKIIYDLIDGIEGDAEGRMNRLAPATYFKDGMQLPPHLIMHGDCDSVVPFSQSADYYRLLRERGQVAHFVRVAGAEHERRFWSQAVLNEVSAFLRAYL